MKNLKNILLMLPLVAVLAALTTGCVKRPDPWAHKNGDGGNKFDFATTTQIPLNVDYSLKGNKALFEVYAENPVTVANGVAVKKAGVKSLLKAYTDNDSKYSGVIDLPTAASRVWLYSESYGMPACVEVEVAANGISFDLSEYREALKKAQGGDASAAKSTVTRAVTKDNPYNIGAIGEWKHDGYPKYLIGKQHTFPFEFFEPVYADIPKNLLNRIETTLLPGSDNSAYAKPTEEVNLKVTEDATMNLVYLAEMAAYKNAIGYYFYDTDNPPKSREEMVALPKYVAFPNCSDLYASDHVGVLEGGMQIRLKYYDGQGKESDIFPKGTTLGWFIIPDGYGEGYLNKMGAAHPILYSNNEFNEDETRHMVSIFDADSGKIVLGFEDDKADGGDYKDVLFYVDTQKGSVTVPEEETKPEDFPDTVGDRIEGTLAFEDLWPSQGDYDMNDVVMRYSTTFTTDKDNHIVAIEDVFTPLNSGGSQKSAFGYLLEIPKTAVKSVTLFSEAHPEGVAGELEQPQEMAVIILYEDIRDAVNKNVGPVTVKIELEKGAASLDRVTRKSLYNPFICVNTEGFGPGVFRKEVHLTNYRPTLLANLTYFGTKDDRSTVDEVGKPIGPYYYGTADFYPFAIDLPIVDYRIPDEKVKIDEFYPYFAGWAASSGKENKDWYKKPAR